MAFNNVEEVQHWPPKRIDGTRYDFSHLNAQQITYTLQATEHQSQKNYTVVVTYSYHVFAKEIPEMGEVEKQQRTYSYHGQVLRPVHDERYMLSKKLPEMIKTY